MSYPKNNRRGQQGFGLIEIMIALALGAIILLGVSEIATQNSITRYELERTGRQIESAAYAMRVIESDITNAAFWGERGEVSPAATRPPICVDTEAELLQAMGYPLQGGQGNVTCLGVPGNLLEPKASTDYLAVRRVSSCPLDSSGTNGCDPAGSNFHLQVHACFDSASALKPGDSFLVKNDVSQLTYLERDCSTTAPQYRYLNHVYYVDANDVLIRAELRGSTYDETKLVENVEFLRFEYGLDSDGDGQVDSYASDVSDPNDAVWSEVVMVRMGLMVRNHESSSGGYVDDRTYNIAGYSYDPNEYAAFNNHRRQLYSRTVSTRNIGGRRETP